MANARAYSDSISKFDIIVISYLSEGSPETGASPGPRDNTSHHATSIGIPIKIPTEQVSFLGRPSPTRYTRVEDDSLLHPGQPAMGDRPVAQAPQGDRAARASRPHSTLRGHTMRQSPSTFAGVGNVSAVVLSILSASRRGPHTYAPVNALRAFMLWATANQFNGLPQVSTRNAVVFCMTLSLRFF